jgi:hypothetical protein
MVEKRIVLFFWAYLIGQLLGAQDLYRIQEDGRFGYIDEMFLLFRFFLNNTHKC